MPEEGKRSPAPARGDVHVLSRDPFREPNPLFGWFASRYLERLDVLEEPRDDELVLARDVMRALHHTAGRPLPPFFPDRPLEEIYDPGRMQWRDLFERSKQATRKRDRERLIIEFADDLQHHEIARYLAVLPQTVKAERRGKKVIIENPREFDRWLDGDGEPRRGWLPRLFSRSG